MSQTPTKNQSSLIMPTKPLKRKPKSSQSDSHSFPKSWQISSHLTSLLKPYTLLFCLILLPLILLSTPIQNTTTPLPTQKISQANPPNLLLLSPCDENLIAQKMQDFLWSEKLDGIRAFWNGKALYSRSGKLINAPAFFTQNFPPFPIDGELWSKRGDFENILSIVHSQGKTREWQTLKFYIFEVPYQKGSLQERLKILENYLNTHHAPFIAIIPQSPLSQPLQEILKHIESLQGEGIVVREKSAPYSTGRSKNAMKCKTYQDRECKITGYIKGRGKFEGKVGSILCQDGDKILKIGSGMDENFRLNPPKIGTLITYKFFGLTNKGNPRFPTFLRIRSDLESQTLQTKENQQSDISQEKSHQNPAKKTKI